MKAIILAAGLGTRLFPFTKNKPKALVEVQGKPLIQHQLEKLKKAGFTQVLVNIHYYGEQIIEFLDKHNNFGLEIYISDERDELLDTGGALRKASDFIRGDEPVLIHNVDVLSNISLREMLDSHRLKGALATLAVRKRETSRYLLFNKQNQLRAWENIKTGEKKGYSTESNLERAAFSGIHIISPKCVDLFPNKKAFSVIDFYIDIIKSYTVNGYFHDKSIWLDVGKPETLAEAEKLII
ncbi:MAG: nucleotidyltransferase family protein [Bacteroidetes bacterium]|nr:MAG: nucleotidyltransferase family protein [Bacteroidota bacterium]